MITVPIVIGIAVAAFMLRTNGADDFFRRNADSMTDTRVRIACYLISRDKVNDLPFMTSRGILCV